MMCVTEIFISLITALSLIISVITLIISVTLITASCVQLMHPASAST